METAKYIEDILRGDNNINVGDTERIVSAVTGAGLFVSGIDGIQYSENKLRALLKLVSGGFMLYRAASGYCPLRNAIGLDTINPPDFLEITETMTVERPVAEVYQAWRQLENLPRFMKHLKEVDQITPKRSHWEAKIPGGLGKISWEAQITFEKENEVLLWTSLPGSAISNSGEVFFKEIDENSTVVKATIIYQPPAGEAGKTIAKILNNLFGNMIREDIRGFKKMIESNKREKAIY
jgi:uncharacterized membrane protein